ncbi:MULTISPECIES: hypothetical protein [Streptomyces]|uniref:Uncharacterized protein n=1 Tax=Streptomyces cacaoi TaxID=1898 RepID=A0A4Y3R3N1_STRCI|nr:MULTISPECIES: hypothetical protein [Streptomyces]NNG88902.1 hypothetical protein [Streptomyces cacaoi]QHF94311.1 hypothetical protein DEH18_11125 [Streptomyces sp. NHF165]GEB51308.1 hypothetical protein SCA03_38590 [Streptomyces cacaoi]
MNTAPTQSEHPPIYEELLEELGDVPTDVRTVAERVMQESEEAVASVKGGAAPRPAAPRKPAP